MTGLKAAGLSTSVTNRSCWQKLAGSVFLTRNGRAALIWASLAPALMVAWQCW